MTQQMHRREFLKTLAATATLLEGPVALPAARRKVERPNILVMLSDDMGWGQPGFQGGTTVPTPNLDRIAQEGVQLTLRRAEKPGEETRRGNQRQARSYDLRPQTARFVISP